MGKTDFHAVNRWRGGYNRKRLAGMVSAKVKWEIPE